VALTPEDVRNKHFKSAFRGYAEEEVDTFLDEVEVELSRLLGDNDTLRQRLETVQSAPPPQPVNSEAEEMLRRTLLLAQRTADETVAEAQAEAQRMVAEARAQAESTIQQAESHAATSLGDLERRRQALEQHIEGLRAFEREYRTRLKAYLESQLRDLDGRQGSDAAGDSSPAAAPAMPPSPLPQRQDSAVAQPPVESPVASSVASAEVMSREEDEPPVSPVEAPVDAPPYVPPVMSGDGADDDDAGPEPYDLDEGTEVPRLAP
jgi:DivIVA domain-containing protein